MFAQAVVPAVRPLGPHPQLAQRQVDVVADHQQVGQRQPGRSPSPGGRSAAQVHERLGLDSSSLLPALDQLGHLGLEARWKRPGRRATRQGVDHVEADVVPGAVVLRAGLPRPTTTFIVISRSAISDQSVFTVH